MQVMVATVAMKSSLTYLGFRVIVCPLGIKIDFD